MTDPIIEIMFGGIPVSEIALLYKRIDQLEAEKARLAGLLERKNEIIDREQRSNQSLRNSNQRMCRILRQAEGYRK